MNAVIVGGGLAGLAVALRLRAAGWKVTVCDNGHAFGGKMNRWQKSGFCFDTGPTLLTMPGVLRDLFAHLGTRLEDHLQLKRLDPHAEYVFPDGSRLTVPADWEQWLETIKDLAPADAAGAMRLHKLGEQIYLLSQDTFFRNHPLTPLRLPPARALRHLPIRHGWGNYAATVQRFIHDPRLRRIYLRYPTYVGSSPYLCPATLLVIPYLEHAFGCWYVVGGMYRIVESLVELACQKGVELVSQVQVQRIEHDHRRVCGVRLHDGTGLPADAVVFNGDAAELPGLLGRPVRPKPGDRSLSGFVVLLGVRERPAGLRHHTVFFSEDYRSEFDDLFGRRRFPASPTVYVNAPNDPALAPPGGQTLFLMANAPGGSSGWDEATAAAARRRVFQRLRQAGLPDLETMAVVADVWHPGRFEQRYLAPGGSIYGDNSHGWRRAFLRPPNRSPHLRGLYCAGGSFHPGGGVPMVLLSAEITAALVLEREGV